MYKRLQTLTLSALARSPYKFVKIFRADFGPAYTGFYTIRSNDFFLSWSRFVLLPAVTCVAAASLLIASRGGASPQKFEKRGLTIVRLEPDPYESVHQLDCSFLFPTAMANGTERYNNFLLSDPTNNKHQRRLIVSTVSETQQKQTKSILPAQPTEQENFIPIAERATDN